MALTNVQQALLDRVTASLKQAPPNILPADVVSLHEQGLLKEFREQTVAMTKTLSTEQLFVLTDAVLRYQSNFDQGDPPLRSQGRLGNDLYKSFAQRIGFTDVKAGFDQTYKSQMDQLHRYILYAMKDYIESGQSSDKLDRIFAKGVAFKLFGSQWTNVPDAQSIAALNTRLNTEELIGSLDSMKSTIKLDSSVKVDALPTPPTIKVDVPPAVKSAVSTVPADIKADSVSATANGSNLGKQIDSFEKTIATLRATGLSGFTAWGKAINQQCDRLAETINAAKQTQDPKQLQILSQALKVGLLSVKTQYEQARTNSLWARIVNAVTKNHDARIAAVDVCVKNYDALAAKKIDEQQTMSVPASSSTGEAAALMSKASGHKPHFQPIKVAPPVASNSSVAPAVSPVSPSQSEQTAPSAPKASSPMHGPGMG